jgi:DNA-binding CsgD family transcriptional regulator
MMRTVRKAIIGDARTELAHERSSPEAFVVDGRGNLLGSTGDAMQLWERIAPEVERLLEHSGENLATNRVHSQLVGDFHIRIRPFNGMFGRVLIVFAQQFRSRDPVQSADRYALTRRECEVARLLIVGARTDEIAERLSISRSTAVLHVRSLMAKLGTRTRAGAVGRLVTHDGDALI